MLRIGSAILNAHQDIEDVLHDKQPSTKLRGITEKIVVLSVEEFKALKRANDRIGKNIVKIVPAG